MRNTLNRRLLPLLLALALCLSLLPVGVFATGGMPETAGGASSEEPSAETAESGNQEDVAGQFVIMSTTDIHGKIWDTNLLNDTSVNNSLLNVSTAVTAYRETYGEENVILLDAGDLYQGTPVSTYQITQYTQYVKGALSLADMGDMYLVNPTAMSMAYIGYDALILGNHEFNYAWDTMSDIYEYLEGEGVPIVVANLYYEDTGERVFSPYLLKTVTVGGQEVTIGVIGLENTDCARWDISDNYPGMIFSAPENESLDLAYEVQKVQAEWAEDGIDPDFVIVCYHGALGSESDTLAYGVNTENQVLHIIRNTTGVDMVISGHDHSTAYSNNTYENAAGEEVLVVNGGGTQLTASVWNVLVDQETGETSVTLGETACIELASSENLNLAQYSADETLKTMVEPYAADAEDYVSTEVGTLLDWDGLSNERNRYYLEQTDTVDLINRAQIAEGSAYLNEKYESLEALNADLQEMYGADTEKQLTQEALVDGKLTVDLSSTSVVTTASPAAGDSELSMKDIYGFYKYDNSLYLLALTGAEIKELLEYNASERITVTVTDGEAVISDTGDGNANFTFPAFYGLNYTIDMAREEGSRVMIEGFSNGKTFSEDQVYIFAVNNYHLGNTYNEILGRYSTADAIWSQTDDLGGGYVQDLIADYVSALTQEYGGVYGTARAEENGESVCSWAIVYGGEEETGGSYTLRVFETSDIHGYLLDSSSGDSETYQYRLAYIADKVNDARAEHEGDDVILLDSGDIFQGNVISNLQDGEPLTAAFDLMEYDAVSIGNHEFDWDYETVIDEDGTMGSYEVGDYAGDSQVPVVASNLLQDGEKVSFADDYVILEKSAVDEEGSEITVTIGVIGWIASYAADIMYAEFTGRGFTADMDYDALETLAVELETEMGCDATILLCHADAGETAKCLNSGTVIDLVCGGHSHRAQAGETEDVVYVEPSSQGATYAYAELVFETDESGAVSGVTVAVSETVPVTEDKTLLYDTEENADELDQEIVALSKAAVENVSDVLNETLGYITIDVTKGDIDGNEMSSTAGNWMSDLLARAVGADVAFTNNGGIRTEFTVDEATGLREITAGDIYTISPFCNAVYAYELTYEELLSILEFAIGEGQSMSLRMSGIDCYYSDGAVTALVTLDGVTIYQDGQWTEDWADRTLVAATNEYVATSDTPFAAWNDTEKLLSKNVIDNEGAIAALKEEAAETGGSLYVDDAAHMIHGVYSGADAG
ncbi:MAG: 5'-nucleotidase C-terminal domain-containing protein [Oscillospiraceae bacterium]|nr:5'-nucleotidase C-terminal domain-containing protein [Oscillospiraceae bacterium]